MGTLVVLAMLGAHGGCKVVEVYNVDIRNVPSTLSLGETVVVQAELYYYRPEMPSDVVAWLSDDPSVVTVVDVAPGEEYEPPRLRGGTSVLSQPALLRAVGVGTTDITALFTGNVHAPDVEGRVTVTVTDACKTDAMHVVQGSRAALVGETMSLQVDVTIYGDHEAIEEAVVWAIRDPDVVDVIDVSQRVEEPYVYRSTLVLGGARVGATRVRATASCPTELPAEPWHEPPPVAVMPVTVAAELDAPFVAIRDGDRTARLGETVCLTAYVGSPLGEVEYRDAWIEPSFTIPEVFVAEGVWGSMDHTYPHEFEHCMRAIGVGVTDVIFTSDTWPEASARVTLEVVE